ncbi:hypothetical protein [Streptomyces sp. NPDC008122]|uniref:hypothetical protein n=1 Tax=Streptomyces sp. NPDC008122 TaxID=3364810 RepID=UPI0036E46E76
MKPTEKVLQDLTQPSNVSMHSDVALVGKVKAAVAADDKKRKENEDEPLRRKPDLASILPTELPRQFEVTLWDVLHTLARATALSWRGAGRGLAEHWGALKYTQALAGGRNSFLGLTDEGHRIADHYMSLQSGELGIGFALTLTEHMLRSRFPDHSVTIVSADTTLRAGWALTTRDRGEKVKYRYRPSTSPRSGGRASRPSSSPSRARATTATPSPPPSSWPPPRPTPKRSTSARGTRPPACCSARSSRRTAAR